MKVQLNSYQNIEQKNTRPQFKGFVDESFRFLATNQAVGANGVDFCFMVVPRTASDMTKRGPAAGMETFRREVMGTVNDSSIGLFGAGAGALAAVALNKKFGLNVNKIFTAPETLNILAENKAEQIKNNQTQLEYIKKTLSEVKAYNPTAKNADAEGFVKLSQDTIDEVSKILDESLNNKVDFDQWTKNSTNKSRSVIINKITENTGAQSEYILGTGKKVSKTNLKSLVNDIYMVSEAFNKESVNSEENINENIFIKKLNKFMKTRAAAGIAIASLVGLSVQPINMYLTKLKTGTDGFVGVEGRSKDNSAGFKGVKAFSSAAFFSMILATLDLSPLKFLKSPKTFMDKMAFNGKMPTINQLKGVYGITIISRIFSARDKDELREVLTKDTLGYLSWLVLGDIVNKLAAEGLTKNRKNADKSVMNYKKGLEDKNIFKRTFYSSLKTRDEILIETLAKNGIKSTKEDGGKVISKSFKEMVRDLDKLSPEIKKATKKRLSTLNKAQLAGYLFSGLVLGLGIPNLNIYITNTLDKKRKAKAEELKRA